MKGTVYICKYLKDAYSLQWQLLATWLMNDKPSFSSEEGAPQRIQP